MLQILSSTSIGNYNEQKRRATPSNCQSPYHKRIHTQKSLQTSVSLKSCTGDFGNTCSPWVGKTHLGQQWDEQVQNSSDSETKTTLLCTMWSIECHHQISDPTDSRGPPEVLQIPEILQMWLNVVISNLNLQVWIWWPFKKSAARFWENWEATHSYRIKDKHEPQHEQHRTSTGSFHWLSFPADGFVHLPNSHLGLLLRGYHYCKP